MLHYRNITDGILHREISGLLKTCFPLWNTVLSVYLKCFLQCFQEDNLPKMFKVLDLADK